MKVTRRDFLKLAGAFGFTAAMPAGLIKKALAGNVHPRAIWLSGQNCTGCSVSLLNSINLASIDQVLLDAINLEYHGTLIAAAGDLAFSSAIGPHPSSSELSSVSRDWLAAGPSEFDINGDGRVNFVDYAALAAQGYILVVEGAIPTASDGKFCDAGGGMTAMETFDLLTADATHIVALGTCAAFGGIPAAAPNPTGAASVSDALEMLNRTRIVVNIPGCPLHPDWFVGTLLKLLGGQSVNLDAYLRPTDFFGPLIHTNCPNLAAYNSTYGREIGHAGSRSCLSCHTRNDSDVPNPRTLGMSGCLYALNCKGRVTHADCATRKWNNPALGQPGVSWCIGSQAPCFGCTEPNFPDGMTPFYTLNGNGADD